MPKQWTLYGFWLLYLQSPKIVGWHSWHNAVISNTSIVNLAATKFWHERQLNWGPVHQYPDTESDTGTLGFSLFQYQTGIWRHDELDYGVNCVLSLVFGYRRLNNSSQMYRLINTSGFGASISTVGQIKWFSCVFLEKWSDRGTIKFH